MELEKDATETEQAYLTWDLAPRARATGMVISALPLRFLSVVSHLRQERHISDEAAGVDVDVGTRGYGRPRGVLRIHPGKIGVFGARREHGEVPGEVHRPSKEELEGRDTSRSG